MTLADQIHPVRRSVDLDASGPVIAVERTFPTTIEDLWGACTDPSRLARWFEPVEGTLELGGRYRLQHSGTEGTVEECTPPSGGTTERGGRSAALAITWEYGGDTSQVLVTFAEHTDGATLTIRHVGAYDAHWSEFGPASGGMGWDESLLALDFLLSGDARAELETLQRELSTDDGRSFLTASAHAWRDAHVTAGAAPSDADAASQRALSAYLAMG